MELILATLRTLRIKLFKYSIAQLLTYVLMLVSMSVFKNISFTFFMFLISLIIPFVMVIDVLIRNPASERLMENSLSKYLLGLLISGYIFLQYAIASSVINDIYAVNASFLPAATAILTSMYFAKNIVLTFSLLVIAFLVLSANLWLNTLLFNFRISMREVLRQVLLGILFVFSFGFIAASPGVVSFISEPIIKKVAWELDFESKNRCTNPEVTNSEKTLFLANDMRLIRVANKEYGGSRYAEKKCHI